MEDQTLQVVLPGEAAAAIRQLAAAESLSMSAYIRRLILSRKAPMVGAWWFSADWTPRHIERLMKRPPAPGFMLERVAEGPDGSFEAAMWDDGQPVTVQRLRTSRDQEHILRELEDSFFVLDGSRLHWRVLRSLANTNAGGQMLVLLTPEMPKKGDVRGQRREFRTRARQVGGAVAKGRPDA